MKRKFASSVKGSFLWDRGQPFCGTTQEQAHIKRGTSCVLLNPRSEVEVSPNLPSLGLRFDATRQPYKVNTRNKTPTCQPPSCWHQQRFWLQCPLPNYVLDPGVASKSLGLKRGLKQGKPSTACAIEEEKGSASDPLFVFVPEAGERDSNDGLSAVEVEPFLATQLRPHQREGVKFIFGCLGYAQHAVDNPSL